MKKLNIVLLLVNVYALISRLIVLAFQYNQIDLVLLFILYAVMVAATVAGYFVWNTKDIPRKEINLYAFSIVFAVITGAII